MGKRPNQLVDVWNWINKAGDNECWPCFLQGQDAGGHRLFNYANGKLYAHRVVYLLVHGEIPEGMYVMHSCSNPACCNPNHLKLGTHGENIKQSYSEGRTRCMGARNGRAKLTPEDVEAIRASTETHAALGRKYGVSEVQIGRVRKRLQYV